MTTKTVTVMCPDWCQGKMSEHEFEVANDYPVQHFAYMRGFFPEEATRLSVSVTRTVHPDGLVETSVGVVDDEYEVAQAEQTALAMLEAVKVARQ